MTVTIFDRLAAPFPPEHISWRIGATNKDKTKAIALAYLDARDVMDRLDDVMGPDGWQCRYSHAEGKTICEIGIRAYLPNPDKELDLPEWVWKADGAGDTDVEAEKGALSAAFKRAAVRWGIGRYLYGLGNTWVDIEPAGKSHRIKESEYPRLRKVLASLTPHSRPAPAPEPDEPARAPAAVSMFKLAMDAATTPDALEAWGKEHAAEMELLHPADRQEVRDYYRAHLNSLRVMKEAA